MVGNGHQAGIDQLLIRSALDPDLQRRLRESPDDVFPDFDLTADEQDILRHPDHRLLPLLGAAFAHQTPEAPSAAAPAAQPEESSHATPQAQELPDLSLALTIVPCLRYDNGEFKGFSYAAWVSPLPPGVDPATLPPPPGTTLPGPPCPPLYAVIGLSAVQLQDAAGKPQAGLWASLRQATNVAAPPAVEAVGNRDASPFGSDFDSPAVRDAVAAVRSASPGERYGRLVSLLGVLRTGDVR
jgi:hypothetical protein